MFDAADATTWIRLRGFPWEADDAAVLRAVLPRLRKIMHGEAAASSDSAAGAALPHDCFLPLDARARPSGDALLRVGADAADALVRELDGQRVDGGRYLEARLSSEAEVAEARERSAQAVSKAQALAPQAFNQTRARSERPAPPEDRREIVVLCHGAPDAVVRGAFELNNLPEGRVDLLARCASSALFYSHGVRRGVRLWLVLSGHGRTLCCDGGAARGLRPDERSLAVAMRRAIKTADHAARQRVAASASAAPVAEAEMTAVTSLPVASHDGWSVVDGDTLEELLKRLRGERAVGCGETATPVHEPLPLLQLHEEGAAMNTAGISPSDDERFARSVVTRELWECPSMPPVSSPEDALKAVEMCSRAQQPRETLVRRTLRRVLALAVQDNDGTLPHVVGPLNRLATVLPAESLAGDAAAGLLLLFSHGLGEKLAPMPTKTAAPVVEEEPSAPLVVMLGFAGGVPQDLAKYASRVFATDATVPAAGGAMSRADVSEMLLVCASELPEVYQHNVEQVLLRVRAAAARGRRWVVHLFSKAGFLMLARLVAAMQAVDERFPVPPPAAVIWDSSPGSVSDYEEFVAGTRAAADLLLKRGLADAHVTIARMEKLLRSDPYAPAVRTSYAPMHGLVPFPLRGCHHLFLYSERDAVCAPAEIRRYASEVAAAAGGGSGGSCESVVVGGTHCDGLFWSNVEYIGAVKRLLAKVAAEEG